MADYELAEVEAAFRRYWQTGIIREDWNGWADLFTADVVYHDRHLGTFQGREAVRAWIVPLAERYREIYGVYQWHSVDPSGRVVFYMQNRRDLPQGGHLDFPGMSILQYAGGGLWSAEEDYWATRLAKKQYTLYEAAIAEHDPGHRARGTRRSWGDGPQWTIGPPAFGANAD